MIQKPGTGVRVGDVAASLGFYVDQLGCELAWRDESADVAAVRCRGYSVLIAGPDAAGVEELIDPSGEAVNPAGSIFLWAEPNDRIEAFRDWLATRGVEELRLVERAWGDRFLTACDPDGYRPVFWAIVDRTRDETLALYESGPDRLVQAVAGLDASTLNLRHHAEHWSIRQMVHHLADMDASMLGQLQLALAEPGRTYLGNPFSQDRWSAALDYAGRDIGPSLALFQAMRIHIAQLVRHLPDAWEHSTSGSTGQQNVVGSVIAMLAGHALEHIEGIRETRQAHGV